MGYKPYRRRTTSSTRVGDVMIGSAYPIRLQSMNNTTTTDVEASADQAERIAAAGADIDRLTAQGVREARAMGEIRRKLRERGCRIPLVADIHFNPKAAFAAAEEVEKVRINPGNFVDPGRVFKKIEFTDEEYAREIEKISETFVPFLRLCREHGTAIRIGVNHGSLSDRIMSRYGDTPEGMVESAMEFLRVAVKENFTDIVISIKASNVVVMTRTVRLLVEAMDREDMHFPLHLGVTEAGDGEDARVKSALGIGSLLADGIGDTIRVSLSEAPEAEIPVARMIVDHIDAIAADPGEDGDTDTPLPERRLAVPLISGADKLPADISRQWVEGTGNVSGKIRSALREVASHGLPVLVHVEYPATMTPDEVRVAAAIDFGGALLDGHIDIISIGAPQLSHDERNSLMLGILQAARLRFTKTEFIACPGCGRTMFDLQDTLKHVKEALQGYPGLKIGVMGCIVNGPGEMADADYGYVGAGVGRVSLYRGKECVLKNIPSGEAVEHLLDLLRADGRIS